MSASSTQPDEDQDEVTWRFVPPIEEDEDGEQWFIAGHDLTDTDAKVAFALYLASPTYHALPVEQAFTIATAAVIERRWASFIEEDWMTWCADDADGAQPFLLLTCPDERAEVVLL